MLQGDVEAKMEEVRAGSQRAKIKFGDDVAAGIASRNLLKMVKAGYVRIDQRKGTILETMAICQPITWVSDRARECELTVTETFDMKQFVLWMSPALESIIHLA